MRTPKPFSAKKYSADPALSKPVVKKAPPAGRAVAKKSPYGEIETLVRARYPLIYVCSWEEGRVLGELEDISARLGKTLAGKAVHDSQY